MVPEGLTAVVGEAWEAFECAARSSRVEPAMPILFFGDLAAYHASPLQVVTVGLNPSLVEFPKGSSFERFPGCAGNDAIHGERYLDCLGSYFCVKPYRRWFSSYDAVLDGAEVSYYPCKPSTALHTDIASPVATNPTWSKLGESEREVLLSKGAVIWHKLLTILKPHVVLQSIARKYLSKIRFAPLEDNWQTLHVFEFTKSGARRSRSLNVEFRWYKIMGHPSLFVFGPASQTPFGLLSNQQKRQVGKLARQAFCRGP